MKYILQLLLIILLSITSFAQDSQTVGHSKLEIGINAGYFIVTNNDLDPYGQVNKKFPFLLKWNLQDGKNAIRFSTDIRYEKAKFKPGQIGMPYSLSFAYLLGYEKRVKAGNNLTPYYGIDHSIRFDINQAFVNSVVDYPPNQTPQDYKRHNQKYYIIQLAAFGGLEAKIYKNLYASFEMHLKAEKLFGNSGGYSFYYFDNYGRSVGALSGSGDVPDQFRILWRPINFLNLTYKFI